MRVNKSWYNNIHFKYGKRAIPPNKLFTTSYKKKSHESVAVADRLIIILGGDRCKKMQPRKYVHKTIEKKRDGDGCLLIGTHTHVHPSYCTYTLICHKVGAIPFRANQCV